jgi:AcrR family transcriptional regulator
MPYPAAHKAETRARIIRSARSMFNRHGFEQVSIDDIMKKAGLTRGGFYHHFKSKDELYAEAVRSFSQCNPFAIRRAKMKGTPEPKKLARLLVELYLSDETLNDVDTHCPLIALPSDVARAGLEPRAAYTRIVQNMLHVFRAAFPEGDRTATAKAQVIINLCVGGMVIARTTDDPGLRQSLRAAARAQAYALLDGAGDHRG